MGALQDIQEASRLAKAVHYSIAHLETDWASYRKMMQLIERTARSLEDPHKRQLMLIGRAASRLRTEKRQRDAETLSKDVWDFLYQFGQTLNRSMGNKTMNEQAVKRFVVKAAVKMRATQELITDVAILQENRRRR